jgi:carboxypeptidase T
VGTDLNRNFSIQFGCCGGSSSNPGAEDYRGPSALSAPETYAFASFAWSHSFKAHIDFHSYSQLVLWPFGFTSAATAPGLNADQELTFRTIGQSMAASNGYTAEQSSHLYTNDGSIIDFMWGTFNTFSYAFELYPSSSASPNAGFYPPDEVIAAETSRNRAAALSLAEYADCPYRAAGKQAQYCLFTVDDPGNQVLQLGRSFGGLIMPTVGAPASWSVSNLPAGLVMDQNGLITGTPTRAGIYDSTVSAVGTNGQSSSTTFRWTVADPAACGSIVTDHRSRPISDFSTVTMSNFNACPNNGSSSSKVTVDITHTYIGDLIVDFIAPDGTVYNLHNRAGGGTDNLHQQYTLNLSGESQLGVWTLRVQDVAAADTGTLDSVRTQFQ